MGLFRTVLLACAITINSFVIACSQDNCYNNLAHSSASASSFCHTFTTTINTAANSLPTFILSECGYSRLSSACSCLYTAASTTTSSSTVLSSCQATATIVITVTPTATVTRVQTATSTYTDILGPAYSCIIKNGQFGLDPWINEDIVSEDSYGYNPLQLGAGDASQYAALVSFPGSGIYEIDQYIMLPSIVTYFTLQFDAYATQASGYCEVYSVVGPRYGGNYFGEATFPLTQSWQQYSYKGTTDGTSAGFVALAVNCGGGTNNAVYIDNIVMLTGFA